MHNEMQGNRELQVALACNDVTFAYLHNIIIAC